MDGRQALIRDYSKNIAVLEDSLHLMRTGKLSIKGQELGFPPRDYTADHIKRDEQTLAVYKYIVEAAKAEPYTREAFLHRLQNRPR